MSESYRRHRDANYMRQENESFPLAHRSFADWAFSPEGLPKLEFLAVRKFSNIWNNNNVLLRRESNAQNHDKPYRKAFEDELGHWAGTNQAVRFLRAGPHGDFTLT